MLTHVNSNSDQSRLTGLWQNDMVEVTLSQLSPRLLRQQAHQWGIYWKIKEEVIYIIGIYWSTFLTDDFILKVHQLGIYLKIKKGGIYNLFNFVHQPWAYCNIKELKDILYYFVFSSAHMCSFSFPPKDYCREQKQIVFRCTGRPTNSTLFLQFALFHKIQLLPKIPKRNFD